ncbi:MAG: carbonic anhydrase [Chloroflexota bacterium]
MGSMSFCTVINCMDGRVQLPVIQYLQKRFNVAFVDSITEAGPNLILAKRENSAALQSILNRLNISITKHASAGVAVAGHYDCAGNPQPASLQMEHIREAVNFLRGVYADIEIIGLWVDENWQVIEITAPAAD